MVSSHSDELQAIGEQVVQRLSEQHAAREQALRLSRESIRHCANAIRAVHRQQFQEAQALLDRSRELLDETLRAVEGEPEIYYTGFVSDAQKEYAEGCLTLAIATSAPLPLPDELKVEVAPYLNGLGEAAGELRRYILDALRRDDVARCEELMETMDAIYGLLVTVDFPDALTGGLRRTTDMVRGVLERTRGDLTMALRQRRLEQRLEQWEQRAGEP